MSEAPWIGTCHVRALSPDARVWKVEADEATASVVVLATGREAFEVTLTKALQDLGLALVWLEEVEPLLQHFARAGMSQSLAALARQANPMRPVVFGEMRPHVDMEELDAALTEATSDAGHTAMTEIDWDMLFTPDAPPLWAVVDGVNCREIQDRLRQDNPPHACLYSTVDPASQALAPWLVRLDRDSPFLDWLRAIPQDRHWGILLQSGASMKELRAHFRKFTMLWTPASQGAPVYFRFYDPRVLADMAATLEPWKMHRFFRPVKSMIAPLSPFFLQSADVDLTEPVDPFAPEGSLDGRLIRIEMLEDWGAPVSSAVGFRIDPPEFEKFSCLYNEKAVLGLARDLASDFPDIGHDALLNAVRVGEAKASAFGMSSRNQVSTMVSMILEFGEAFPSGYPEAETILFDEQTPGWRKRDQLVAWRPRGRIRAKLMRDGEDDGQTIGRWIERKKLNEALCLKDGSSAVGGEA